MKTLTAGLALALAAFAVGAPSKSTITKVTSTNVGGGVEIAVQGESLQQPKTFFASGHSLFVVQFDAYLVPAPGKFQVDTAGVGYVRYVRFQAKPAVSRLTIQVGKGTEPVVSQDNGTWYVRFGVADSAKPQTDAGINDDSAAFQKAIEQLGAPVGTKGVSVLSGDQSSSVKLPSQDLKKANSEWKPGDIVGFVPTAGFTQPTTAAELLKAPNVPGPIGSPFKDTNISLTMNQADILVILESFARQAHVNIVSAPDVSPKDKPLLLSLKMDDVDLDFAMTTVTALADLRFTRIGDTFIVSKSGDFRSRVSSIVRQSGGKYETRVVDLSSGEAKQIRDATLQTLPQDGPDGYYEIVDPTVAVNSADNAFAQGGSSGANNGAADNGAATNGGNAGNGTANPTGGPQTNVGTPASKRAKYVLLIGEPRRLDVIEGYVRELDKRISSSFSLAGTANYSTVVVPIVSGQTLKVKDMLMSVLATNPRRGDYTIDETSVKELAEGQESVKMLLIAGPKDELEYLRAFADTLDAELCANAGMNRDTDPESFKQFYEVVDLKFIEPTHAAFDLKSRVRGLYVTILPDPVTPGLSGQDSQKKQDTGDAGTGANGAAGGSTGGAAKTAEITRQVGHEQMRLVLRGTKTQILEAKDYLKNVDLPARQVSVEMRVMEMSKTDAQKVGLDWSLLSGGRLTSFRMNQGLGANADTSGTTSFHYQDNATSSLDFLGLLDSISNKNNLIARPNTLVTDGRSSHLFVGDTIRYVKTINASQNGTTVEIDKVEVGVTVDLTARVGADGNISLDLDQTFSILNGFTPVPGGGQIPQTSDRKSSLFLSVKDGETIALGGLIQDQDRRSVSGIPILKDLPLIGVLFRRTDNSKIRTEVVFFLTAHVVDNTNALTAGDPRKSDGGGTTANPKGGKGK